MVGRASWLAISKERALTKSVDPSAIEAAVLLKAAEEVTTKAVRAWMLRMLRWGAGSGNAELLLGLLDEIGLRHSRRFVEQQGEWLASRGYLAISSRWSRSTD